MDRRAFIVGGIAAIALPVGVEAQKAKAPVVGVLSPWGPSLHPRGQREPFERGLGELGWIPNSTIVIEQRYAEGKPDQLPRLAMELARMPIDVIVANGSSASRAARDATSTIPIVMAAANDPVGEGLVESLARPGGNVTGLSVLPQGRIEPKQLELLKEAVSGLTRVGVLANRFAAPAGAGEISTAARALNLRTETFEVSRPEDIADSFAAIAHAGVGAVLVRPDPLVLDAHLAQCASLAIRHRLPTVFFWLTAPSNHGGLMAYGPEFYEIHRRSAFYVDRILKGAKPAELPVEQPTKFRLVINLKTAKALGLTIPPSLLLRADQVIE
jgi:putative ABC transport system substrate-binding protein